jgi:hypothetical protein
MTFRFGSDQDLHESDDPNPALLFDAYPLPPAGQAEPAEGDLVRLTSTPHSASQFGAASIEAWPAAGGGLLVGIVDPALAGAAPLRMPVKTIFLCIDRLGSIRLIVPYVVLEPEARRCALALVADALAVPESTVMLTDKENDPQFRIVDVCPATERSLQACAAAARILLRQAAAEIWRVAVGDCATIQGCVQASGRSAAYGDLAADAALETMPPHLPLGHGVSEPVGDYTKVWSLPTCK